MEIADTSLFDSFEYEMSYDAEVDGELVPRGAIGSGTVEDGEPISNCMGDGEQFLRYAAEKVGGGKYYFAPTGNQLEDIFVDIVSNLATRLTQ